ncbi:MAG: MGMT family protein [Acidobacteria bacterium]|nr:MGMT family protein [Acidobacteriota bacterium]
MDRELAFEDSAIAVILATRPGDLMTYGEVASEAGYPGAARAVGSLLRKVPDLPWWRIISSTGRLLPRLRQEQAELLRTEGHRIHNGRVAPDAD